MVAYKQKLIKIDLNGQSSKVKTLTIQKTPGTVDKTTCSTRKQTKRMIFEHSLIDRL